ncbi:hypothetical protein L210DRAFT_3515963 [Boletus edulis BED1]|uniref:Uncharacterized protein n=1 Tax=Boletus edulis BED1 TaxID=1328754 RepID=A0AAD4C9F1_BOLED|nr:hypothetical protein L210DRAFT_3515963 [Boletus edulis BED1]
MIQQSSAFQRFSVERGAGEEWRRWWVRRFCADPLPRRAARTTIRQEAVVS